MEASRTTIYAYDLNGGIAKLTHPNNDTIEKSFDSLGRATSITTRTAGTTHLSTYSHGFDLAGNCRKIVEDYASGGLPDRTVTNTYDLINRLTHETVGSVITQYQYDNGHNRTAKLVTGQPAARTVYTNSLNQADYHYIDTNGNSIWDSGETKTTYLHDFDGNRTSATKLVGSTSTTDSYGYDYENRLISIQKATPGPDLQTGTHTYLYDYRTRRVERDEPASSTKLIFSGGTSVQEYTNAATTPTVEFIRGSDYGGGIGGILYSLRAGIASFTHYNHRGDVVAKTSSSGALTFQASYEAYGKRTASQGSTLDRQKANTKDEDPTGLLNEGFRYRDLESGTFITRDPLGFVDGPNVYAYVQQNPWSGFDPDGLFMQIIGNWLGERWQAPQAVRSMSNHTGTVVGVTQSTLAVASMVPLVGKLADGLSAGVSAAEGNYGEAAMTAGGGSPGKLLAKAKAMMNAADGASDLGKIIKEGAEQMQKNGDELAGASAKATKEGSEAAAEGGGKFKENDVGGYKELRDNRLDPNLRSHHVGQKRAMSNLVEGYDENTAPAILVNKVGHNEKNLGLPAGRQVVSRSYKDIKNARDLIARDIRELRRVYSDVPNSKLQELIQKNKDMYKEVREKNDSR